MHDIVYILRKDIDTDEVKYSLRSVEKNFPFRSVWFYCGKPEGITPDHYVKFNQIGASRYMKVTNTIKEICTNDDITKQFWLFNDDFFIMQKVKAFPTLYAGTLWERCDRIKKRHGRDSFYSRSLRETAERLKDEGFEQLDYAIHCPILIDRAKALQTIEHFEGCSMFRALYGNYNRIGGQQAKDNKIMNTADVPGECLFVSTSDRAYKYGAVGKYIRDMFSAPSRFEQ